MRVCSFDVPSERAVGACTARASALALNSKVRGSLALAGGHGGHSADARLDSVGGGSANSRCDERLEQPACNELKNGKHKRYFLHRPNRGTEYTLRAADDTPFFHHVAMLSELQKAAQPDGVLYTYHFNMLRSALEKTATFFGKKDFSACLEGVEDKGLYARALNLLSHGKYSLYEPVEMLEDNKQLFRDILDAFLNKHAFDLPALLNQAPPTSPFRPADAVDATTEESSVVPPVRHGPSAAEPA